MPISRNCFAVGLLTLLLPMFTLGDDTPTGEKGIEVPHLLADHVVVVVLQPNRFLNSNFGKSVPQAMLEESTAESGFDWKTLEQLVWALKSPTAEDVKAAREGNREKADGEGPSMFFEFAKAPERQPILDAMEVDKTKQHGDREYYLADELKTVAFPTDETVVFGPEAEVKRVLDVDAKTGEGALANRLRTADRQFDLLLVCDLTGHEELVELLVDLGKQDLPPQMGPQLELAEKVKSLVLVADLDGDTLIKANVEARDGEVDEVKARLDGVVQLVRTLYQFSGRPELQRSPLPFKEQALTVADDLLAKLGVSAEGNTVTLAVARPKGMDELLKAAKPFLDQVGGAAGDVPEEGTSDE